MTSTQTLERNNGTGLTDSTHSSSSSAMRYSLDEQDERPILMYKYRGGLQTSSQKDLCAWLDKGRFERDPHRVHVGAVREYESSVIPCEQRGAMGMAYRVLPDQPPTALTRRECAPYIFKVDSLTNLADEKLRVTRKPIPRLCSYLDVKRHDLYLPGEKREYAKLPNFDSNLASIKVPSLAYWSRLLFGSYQELYIVSPESSPNSSVADDDSRRTSPTCTWSREQSEEARLGGMVEEQIKS